MLLRFLDTWMHRLRVPYALRRWICDRYEALLLTPVDETEGRPVRTLIGAAEPEPPPREPVGRISFTATTGTATTTTFVWWAPPTETQPREPYRGHRLRGRAGQGDRARRRLMDQYTKAIVGAVMAGLGALATAYGDGHVTGQEWVTVAVAAVGTLALVWGVPNSAAK